MRRAPGLRSLRWRLTGLIGAVLVLSVTATFLAVYHGTGSALRGQIDRELRTDVRAFDRGGVPASARSAEQIERTASAYMRGQPFRASSRLLILRVGGRAPVTNEPELLGSAPAGDGEGAARERDEQAQRRALLGAPTGFATVRVSDVGKLRLYTHRVVRDGRAVATIGVGESLAPAERAQREVARTFLLAGSITLIVALLAAYAIASRTSEPLRRMARIAAQIDAGDLSPRMGRPRPRDEVRMLAESFDNMLDRLEGAFARQRAFASDASHELRTPLTVIRGQLEVLARQPDPDPAEVRRVELVVQREIVRMQRLVEDLLVLARADEGRLVDRRSLDLATFVHEQFEGLRATADRRFELTDVPEGTVTADADRLAQALRNLVRNAIEHTEPGGLVRLAIGARGDRVTLAVEDDGPGIPVDQRDLVFDRFQRIDVARTRADGGAGLGLAIVRAIAQAHGGRAAAGESPEGGARVELELPGFAPAPAYAPAVSSSS